MEIPYYQMRSATITPEEMEQITAAGNPAAAGLEFRNSLLI